MQGFDRQEQRLLWIREHETLQIEAWGHDSLRVRSTMNANIGESMVNVLLPPTQTDVHITIGEQEASMTRRANAPRP